MTQLRALSADNKVPRLSGTVAQVQSLTLSVLEKQMAVLGQDHLSLIVVCMSLAEVGDSAGVTSGQTWGSSRADGACSPQAAPVCPCLAFPALGDSLALAQLLLAADVSAEEFSV